MRFTNQFRLRFALSLALLVSVLAPVCQAIAGGTDGPSRNLWRRIMMIGASATAGFTVREPLGGTNTQFLRLNRYVDAAIIAPHAPALNLASALFFIQPESAGKSQVALALKEQPSVVLAVDFPFWFCYGRGTNDAERLLRFEGGLKLLESVPCPLVLGEIPDASAAVGKMLRPDQMPGADALAAANVRLKSWAATRPNVVLVPLARFMQAAARDQSIAVHGGTIPAGHTRRLLQSDDLHPTPAGCSVMALAIMDSLQAKTKCKDAEVNWNAEAVLKQVAESLRVAPLASATNSTPANAH